MEPGNERKWTKGKVLAATVTVCVVVAALVVTLVLVLGGGNTSDPEAGQGGQVSEDELVETYEEIAQEADEAAAEMEDLTSPEATSDPQAYEQELEEALAAYEELALLVDEAANAAIEVSEDYEELYAYIDEYYDYLYLLTEEAVDEIEYLISLLPALEDIQQMQEVVERLQDLPGGGQASELSSQLDQYVQKVLDNLEGTQASEGMSTYGSELEALTQELDSIAQQMTQVLQSGNAAGLSSLADQMNAAIAQTQQQLNGSIDALLSGYTSALAQLEAAIQSVLP